MRCVFVEAKVDTGVDRGNSRLGGAHYPNCPAVGAATESLFRFGRGAPWRTSASVAWIRAILGLVPLLTAILALAISPSCTCVTIPAAVLVFVFPLPLSLPLSLPLPLPLFSWWRLPLLPLKLPLLWLFWTHWNWLERVFR